MNAALRPADEDAYSLPAWIYSDPEFFELEKAAVFRTSWQLVCHSSDIPRPGDFHTFEFLGESIVTLRSEDERLRSFHNVCRHRGARLLDGDKGHCGRRITCPYHAWTYGNDGRLLTVPNRKSFPGLDPDRHGLAPVEQEIFLGFIFIRLVPGGPSVREMAAPYAHEMAAYRMEELVPQGRVTLRPRSVNWKNVADNYSDGLHITVAHPGLTRLPLSPTTTLIREIAYVHPDERREMRAARYLNWRINRRVNLEDKALIERVQAGMASSSYTVGPLSEGEVCLRSFGRRMRNLIPECRSWTRPTRVLER
jgi:phenylpropionate dioxygenase-like ring-hydroxylating dioxygenase large terminal subunit